MNGSNGSNVSFEFIRSIESNHLDFSEASDSSVAFKCGTKERKTENISRNDSSRGYFWCDIQEQYDAEIYANGSYLSNLSYTNQCEVVNGSILVMTMTNATVDTTSTIYWQKFVDGYTVSSSKIVSKITFNEPTCPIQVNDGIHSELSTA